MPELPEVETIKRRLAQVLPNKVIANAVAHSARSFSGQISELIGQKIIGLHRRAKVLEIKLDSDQSLLTHLKMTGQLIFMHDEVRIGGGHPSADWVRSLPSTHTRIEYTFTDGSKLFFNDMRLFGWMRLLSAKDVQLEYDKYGPDVIDPALSAAYLYEQFQKRRTPIKQVIMDSSLIGGIGNIYACDALNLARISPFRPANSLTFSEVEELLAAARTVIELAISLNGTTFDGSYVTADGMSGGYQNKVLAYGREGQPCYNCSTPLKKKTLGGRGTYYCEVCQK